MLEMLADPNVWIGFFILTSLEIVLGIDNIIFITVLVSKLPKDIQDSVRRFGLVFAMATRIALLFSLSWIVGLTEPFFTVVGKAFSGRDLVLLVGGVFLIWKASQELYSEVENTHENADGNGTPKTFKKTGAMLMWSSVIQIGILDIVFSLDSVITAVGMVDHLPVMVAAVVAAVGVMMFAAKPIGEFVEKYSTLKVLALAFLLMVGLLLVSESFGVHVPKPYLYSAMGFSLLVEFLNIRAKSKRKETF
jgi:predicted tellurium resistance membrane protein TerC